MTEFPFGLDPAGWVPNPEKPVRIKVADVGEIGFGDGNESIAAMAAHVVAFHSLKAVMKNDSSNYCTVTAWDPMKRVIEVKLNNPPA